MKKIIIILLVLILLTFLTNCKNKVAPKDCTQDVKICPDETTVSRVPPYCNFEPCPQSECKTKNDCPTINCIQAPCPEYACIDGECVMHTCGDGKCERGETTNNCPQDCDIKPEEQCKVKNIRTIKDKMVKSMDWHHGKNLITFGKWGLDGYVDVAVMNPDGSGETCITCGNSEAPQKHNGNPAWHPSGDYIVYTAEREDTPDNMDGYAIPGSGTFNDLWLSTDDGDRFYRLTDYSGIVPIRAVIHPQFSHDGNKLFWAERVDRGESFSGGWVLKIADFVIEDGVPKLMNIESLTPGEKESAFYESHAFSKDDKKILFSGDLKAGQTPYGLDIYEYNLETEELIRLTHTDNDWDEHAHYSPDETKIAWLSQTGHYIDWNHVPKGKFFDYLKSELWIMDADGSNKKQLTFFNTPDHPDYFGYRTIVSDSAWSPDGKSLIVLLAYDTEEGLKSNQGSVEEGLKSKHVMVDLECSYCGNGVCEISEKENCPADCEFGFGVGYVPYGEAFKDGSGRTMAEIYNSAGTTWGKTIIVQWNDIEPNPPILNRHNYNFNAMDALVREWHDGGVKNLQIWVASNAAWAIYPLWPPGGQPRPISAPPKADRMDDYYDFIYALVERYDNDGIDDMPGLKYPIYQWEIESEPMQRGFWLGTKEEYIELLRTARRAAKAANPDSVIILGGLALGNSLDDYHLNGHDDSKLDETVREVSKYILSFPELFDVIEFHYLGDYEGAYGVMAWLNDVAQENGYEPKPVWAGDCFSGPQFAFPNNPNPLVPNETTNELITSIAESITDSPNEIEKWYRKEQASLTVKKFVVSMDAGLEGVMMGNTVDWWGFLAYINHVDPIPGLPEMSEEARLYLVNSVFHGMIGYKDLSFPLIKPPSVLDKPRPVYYTMKMLTEKLENAQFIERLNAPDGVYLFKFVKNSEPIFVAWYEDQYYDCPLCDVKNDGSRTIDISQYVPTEQVKVAHIVTELDGNNNAIYQPDKTMPSNSLLVGEKPVFLTESEDGDSCGNVIIEPGEICCSGIIYTGDCCDDNDCNVDEICQSNSCQVINNEVTGDLNNDGKVDLADVMLIVNDFGKTSSTEEGLKSNQGSVEEGLKSKHVMVDLECGNCGNGICEEGETDYCPHVQKPILQSLNLLA